MRKWLKAIVGCIALLVGVVGLITPFLPGWLLIGVGMLLLSPHVPIFEKWLAYLESRLPASRPHLHKVRQWLD